MMRRFPHEYVFVFSIVMVAFAIFLDGRSGWVRSGSAIILWLLLTVVVIVNLISLLLLSGPTRPRPGKTLPRNPE